MNTREYIEYRIKGDDGDWLGDIDWDSKKTIMKHPIGFFSQMFEVKHDGISVQKNTISVREKSPDGSEHLVEIVYKNSFEPDFLSMYHLTHDGTLMFVRNMFWDRTYSRLVRGESLGSRNIKTVFEKKDFNKDGMIKEESYYSYNIRYLVSDILWNTMLVRHVDEPNGKMFPGQKDSYAMAIRCELIEKTL